MGSSLRSLTHLTFSKPEDRDLRLRNRTYQGHGVELDAEQIREGEWLARATVVIADGKKPMRIPIFGRRRATFDTQREADSYGFELAKLWIEGKMWGSNGHGLPD